MKSLILILLLPLLSNADPRVGNGGGTWICEGSNPGSIRWIHFVDLFEAEMEFGFTLKESRERSHWRIYEERRKEITSLSPMLESLMQAHPVDFKKVIRMLPESTDLTMIEDALIRVRPAPETCPGGYLYYGQLANFTHDGRLLISSRIWNHPEFSALERSALLMHEAVYKALRRGLGDDNSSRARRIVGILFAQLPEDEKAQLLDHVLRQKLVEFF